MGGALNRRDFLRTTAIASGAIALTSWPLRAGASDWVKPPIGKLGEARPKVIVGYCDRLSVRPGETIRFMSSCKLALPVDAKLVRLRKADGVSPGVTYKEEEIPASFSGHYPGRDQPLNAGSYVEIDAKPALDGLRTFTVQTYAFPTRVGFGEQTLVGRWDTITRRGWALLIDRDGYPTVRAGDGTRTLEARLSHKIDAFDWSLLSATFDLDAKRYTVRCDPAATSPGDAEGRVAQQAEVLGDLESVEAPGVALRFAASSGGPGLGRRAKPTAVFNGKLDRPRMASHVLTPAERLAAASAPAPSAGQETWIGFWDFSIDIASLTVSDRSPAGLRGVVVNLPVRAVTGYNWTGAVHDWRLAPEQYGAIHFHESDLYDAEWRSDFAYKIPPTLPSGVYAARLRVGGDEHYSVFFVCPPKGKTSSRLAVLMPTASYLAYANHRIAISHAGRRVDHCSAGGGYGAASACAARSPPLALDRRPAAAPVGAPPALGSVDRYLYETHETSGGSLYDVHTDGSGCHFASRLRPIVKHMNPKIGLWALPADTDILDWLDQEAIAYDVITDDILDREGIDLLKPYQAVVSGTHPEYVTAKILDAIEQYLSGGGRFLYAGGNGFYWRVSFLEAAPLAIELRRAEGGTRAWASPPGEYHHQFDGELGGLWRRLNRAPQKLFGVGFCAMGFEPDEASSYRKQPDADSPRARFIFEGVDGDVIGDFGAHMGGAVGEEIDRADIRLGTPHHALVVASAKLEKGWERATEEFMTQSHVEPGAEEIRADMVFFETPNGGAVFSTGSIAWASALAHNDYRNNVSQIMGNVVRRFLDPRPFTT